MRTLLSIIFYLLISAGFAQTTLIDSLSRKLEKAVTKKERTLILMSLSYSYISADLSKALELSDESIKLADQIGQDSLSLAVRQNQATIYLSIGSYSRALELYTYVKQEAEKIGLRKMGATATANSGAIYYHNKDHKSALRHYFIALAYFNEVFISGDSTVKMRSAPILNNIGIIYEEAGKFDSAIHFYDKGLKLTEQLHDSLNMANTLNNFGTLYRDKGNADLALKYYMQAMDIRIKINDKFGMARSYLNIGTFYLETRKDFAQAEAYLNRGLELGTENGSLLTISSASGLLHKVYKESGENAKAYEILLLNQKVSDSLYNGESTRKIAQLEMQSEFDRKQAQREIKQKEKEFYYFMGAAGLVSLLVIVTLLFFLQRSKTKRSQLEQEHLELEKSALKKDLAIKDKELAANIMYLLNKNELINTISEKLLSIKEQVNAESKVAVHKVVLDLQSNLQPELWQEFEFRFQQVHEKFYRILNEKFPDLSPSERRLCAFLKLDMTTKEISAITHQNAKSIDVARTRLRKKLNLTGTDHNLVTFLAQLDNEGNLVS